MDKFPKSVRRAINSTGTAASCMPVKLDGGEWETALFIHLAGNESAQDRWVLSRDTRPVPVGVEGDMIETDHGAIIVLRLEVYTFTDDPLAVEILFTPGGVAGHFQTLRELTRQPRLCWFFGDDAFRVIHSQQHPLTQQQRDGFNELMLEAVRHDAVTRCTGRYDAKAALTSVVTHYDLRASAEAATVPTDQRNDRIGQGV